MVITSNLRLLCVGPDSLINYRKPPYSKEKRHLLNLREEKTTKRAWDPSKQSTGLFFCRALAVKRQILRIPSLVAGTGLSSQLSKGPLDLSPKFSQQQAARKIWSFVSRPPPYSKEKRHRRVSFFFWLRGLDSNQRPPGYEPDELPTALPRDIPKCLIIIADNYYLSRAFLLSLNYSKIDGIIIEKIMRGEEK